MSDSGSGGHQPNWYPDPMGRHEYRWFDGTTWTDSVSSHGKQSIDPVAAQAKVPVRDVSTDKIAKDLAAAGVVAGQVAGGGHLMSEPVLVVNQKAKLIELNNEYAISDQHGTQIGAVRQVGQSAAKKALRLMGSYDQFFTHKLQVLDHSHQVDGVVRGQDHRDERRDPRLNQMRDPSKGVLGPSAHRIAERRGNVVKAHMNLRAGNRDSADELRAVGQEHTVGEDRGTAEVASDQRDGSGEVIPEQGLAPRQERSVKGAVACAGGKPLVVVVKAHEVRGIRRRVCLVPAVRARKVAPVGESNCLVCQHGRSSASFRDGGENVADSVPQGTGGARESVN